MRCSISGSCALSKKESAECGVRAKRTVAAVSIKIKEERDRWRTCDNFNNSNNSINNINNIHNINI